MNLAREARCFMRAGRHAVLSTLSQALPGHPYGSLAPYVLDAEAHPVLLLSRLAEHTKNIVKDARVSLIVLAAGGAAQENARVTFLGRALPLDPGGAAAARYLRYLPAARRYRSELDFEFFTVEPVSLRVIAGFAQAHWLSREAYAPPAGDLAEREAAVVAELNAAHAAMLHALCGGESANAREIEIAGIDCDGFDVRADATLVRFDFDECLPGADAAHAAAGAIIRAGRAPPG